MSYNFTSTWFLESGQANLEAILPQLNPKSVIETGCYEGRCSAWIIENAISLENLYCIDTWAGGIEHQAGGNAESNMPEVYDRFQQNIKEALAVRHSKGLPPCKVSIIKDNSDIALAKLYTNGIKAQLVYVDGSHQAPDVLADAVLSWRLLDLYGIMIFDDYPWKEQFKDGTVDLLRCPKIAIDAFTQIYFKKIRYIPVSLYQIYIQRIE